MGIAFAVKARQIRSTGPHVVKGDYPVRRTKERNQVVPHALIAAKAMSQQENWPWSSEIMNIVSFGDCHRSTLLFNLLIGAVVRFGDQGGSCNCNAPARGGQGFALQILARKAV